VGILLLDNTEQDVSWWDYATAYDLLCQYNYHYQALKTEFTSWLRAEFSASEAQISICELGAGTGNFLIEAKRTLENAAITHWDWNSEMVQRAKQKYNEHHIDARTIQSNISELKNHERRYDLIIAINALYSFPSPQEVIRNSAQLLNEGGYLYVVDVGRPINTMAWTKDLFVHVMQTEGLWKSVAALVKLRKAITQNRKIDKTADEGTYWRHDLRELSTTIESTGLTVITSNTCYRGIADRVIARR